jgi:hypothetical protein|tara:strand:- start:22033 stop:22230 length:198 start_codon:yes stop_codon:yes gene_type:complete
MTESNEVNFDSSSNVELENTMQYLLNEYDATPFQSSKRVIEDAIEAVANVIRLRETSAPTLSLVA